MSTIILLHTAIVVNLLNLMQLIKNFCSPNINLLFWAISLAESLSVSKTFSLSDPHSLAA